MNSSMTFCSYADELTDDQFAQFDEVGYPVLPGFLPDDLVQGRLEFEMDPREHWMPPVLEPRLEGRDEFVALPPLPLVLGQLLGSPFVRYRLSSDWYAPDFGGKPWGHSQRVLLPDRPAVGGYRSRHTGARFSGEDASPTLSGRNLFAEAHFCEYVKRAA